MQCNLHPIGSLKTYKYVVICSYFEGKWILSRHKNRNTWETQGGHIEPGETPETAARRELFEESGITDADPYPLCDYYGYDALGYSNGVAFLAIVHCLGTLPESEIAETRIFDSPPDNLTYPNVSPLFFQEAQKKLHSLKA